MVPKNSRNRGATQAVRFASTTPNSSSPVASATHSPPHGSAPPTQLTAAARHMASTAPNHASVTARLIRPTKYQHTTIPVQNIHHRPMNQPSTEVPVPYSASDTS